MTNSQAVEILIQIRDDLRGIHATNAGLAQVRAGMAATGQAARVQARAIDSEFGKLAQGIQQKFNAKNIGMSLLGGLGLGSGMAVIDTVIGKATQAYEAHQQKLQEIDATWKSILEKAEAYRFSNMSSEGQIEALEAKLADLHAQHVKLLTPKEIETKIFTPGGGVITSKATPTFGSSDELKAQAELLQKIQDTAIELEQAKKRAAEATGKAGEAARKAADDAAAALEKLRESNRVTWAEMQNGYQSALAAMPVNEFQARRDAIEDMFYAGKIGAEEASKEMEKVDADYNRVTATAQKHLQVWQETFALIRGEGVPATEELSEGAKELGWAFSSAFEDAILSGKKLSDVLRGLARDILQIAIRKAVTEPIGSAVGNFFSSIFAAGGGTFLTNGPTQLTVGDNPGGAELVSVLPLSGVGTTRVSGSVAQMAGGGSLLAGMVKGREVTVVQNINLSTGVQGTVRAEIMAMLPMFRSLAQDSVREGLARGEL